MPSAEATLQFQTSVGIASPTMLQTLLELLNLYISDDTEKANWVRVLESHPLTLMPVVAPHGSDVESWAADYPVPALSAFSLALANQMALGHPVIAVSSNDRLVRMAEQLAGALAPDLVHKAGLTSRLSGQDYRGADTAVQEALGNQQRPLAQLEDAALLTRITAAAWYCTSTETPDTDAVAQLFTAEKIGVDSDSAFRPVPADGESDSDSNLQEAVGHHLALANLKHTLTGLAGLTSRDAALKSLAAALFDTTALQVFLQKEQGWSNGSQHLQSEHSLVVAAAVSGRTTSSSTHALTLIDEKVLVELDCTDALAVPVLLDDDPDSCAAVMLVGLSKARLLETAGRQDLITDFQTLAKGLMFFSSVPQISLEDLDNRAREIIHEASNPLSTIQNYLKVLSIKLDPNHEAQATLEIIVSELQRTADVIRQFRDLGEDKPQDGRSRVNPVLRELGSLFSHAHEQISIEYPLDDSDPEILMPAKDLKQVLTNLLKNAVEANPDTIRIGSRGQVRTGQALLVEITISDNGTGIAADIGDVFSRGNTTKTGDHRGEGLAVVRQLTERAGGYISYRTDHRGTEFRLSIPQFYKGELP